jgi:predicted PurR-regulated permease PerM
MATTQKTKTTTKKKQRSGRDKIIQIINPLSEGKASVTKSLELLASALALVAGLAWNDAIKTFISEVVQPVLDQFFSQSLGNAAVVIAPFIYAIIITFLVVYFVTRIKKVEDAINRKDEDVEVEVETEIKVKETKPKK